MARRIVEEQDLKDKVIFEYQFNGESVWILLPIALYETTEAKADACGLSLAEYLWNSAPDRLRKALAEV